LSPQLYTAPDDAVEVAVLDAVETRLSDAFGLSVGRLARSWPPGSAWSARRGQYDASALLRMVSDRLPEDATRVLGVTTRDIFLPGLTFVFGQAQLEGPAALVSLARLQQEFYGFPRDAPLLIRRACTEAVHELGHTFGLVHCHDPRCAMSLSTTVDQVDAKLQEFCRSCWILLKESAGMAALSSDRSRDLEEHR
jgi:archaemetzincin